VPKPRRPSGIFLVDPESSGAQTSPPFFWEGVRDDRVVAHRSTGSASGTVEHRASVTCSVSAAPDYLKRETVVQFWCNWTPRNHHASKADVIGYANRELVSYDRAMMTVLDLHESVGLLERDRYDT
jgi:hypothetical protein